MEEHESVCDNVGCKEFTPVEVLPEPGKNKIKFRKANLLFKCPLRAYLDFECALEDIYEQARFLASYIEGLAKTLEERDFEGFRSMYGGSWQLLTRKQD